MQYVEYVKLALVVLGFLVDLVKDIQAKKDGEQSNPDTAVDSGLDLLGKIGTVGKVKELEGIDLKAFAPELKSLVAKIHALNHQNDVLRGTVELPKQDEVRCQDSGREPEDATANGRRSRDYYQ